MYTRRDDVCSVLGGCLQTWHFTWHVLDASQGLVGGRTLIFLSASRQYMSILAIVQGNCELLVIQHFIDANIDICSLFIIT